MPTIRNFVKSFQLPIDYLPLPGGLEAGLVGCYFFKTGNTSLLESLLLWYIRIMAFSKSDAFAVAIGMNF